MEFHPSFKITGIEIMFDDWPVPAFHFSVKIASSPLDSAFQEVSGIESQIETEEYREGGNNQVYYLPKSIKNSNLSLKRGIANVSSLLVLWCIRTLESQLSEPLNPEILSVMLLNENRIPCRIWVFENAYPIKWKIDGFNSTKSEVAIEEIELCYSRTRRVL